MIHNILHDRSLNRIIGNTAALRCEGISNLCFVKRFGISGVYEAHDGCVNAIQFNSIGDKIVSGSDDTHLCITDLVLDKTVLKHPTGHTLNIFQTKHVPGADDEIVTSARDGSVRHHHVRGGHVHEREVAKHAGSAHKLCVYNRHEVISAGEDGCVLRTDLRTDKFTTIVDIGGTPLYSIDSDLNNYFILTGVSSNTWLYDLRSPNEPALTFNPGKSATPATAEASNDTANSTDSLSSDSEDSDEKAEDAIESGTCCKFNNNGSAFIVSYNNDKIYMYSTHDNSQHLHTYSGHRNNETVKGVNFYGINSEYVMSGSDCGHIFLWDSESEEIVQCLVGEEDGIVNCLEFNTSSPMLASAGLEHCVKIWTPNLEDPTTLEDLESVIEGNSDPSFRSHLSRDVLSIFLSRMTSADDLQQNCRQS